MSEIKVCTLNVWGLYISRHRRFRIEAIAESLSTSDFDIIGLQELWVESDYHVIRGKLMESHPHAHRFQSGIIGSGLTVLSKYPISHLDFYSYRLNGKPLYVQHGDWFAGKGIGMARIAHPLRDVDFYVTHMVANYHSAKGNDVYAVQRLMQLVEFCKFISKSKAPESVLIALGDLNIDDADNLLHEVVEKGMFLEQYEYRSKSIWTGYTGDKGTFNRPSSSYHNAHKKVETIDHIFYDPNELEYSQVSLCMAGRIGRSGISYSDHCGISATFVPSSTEHTRVRGKSAFSDYYLTKAIKYNLMLARRQEVLQLLSSVAFVAFLASILVSAYSRNIKHSLITIGNVLFIPGFLTIAIFAFLYSSLWLSFERNQILTSTSEWAVWLSRNR